MDIISVPKSEFHQPLPIIKNGKVYRNPAIEVEPKDEPVEAVEIKSEPTVSDADEAVAIPAPKRKVAKTEKDKFLQELDEEGVKDSIASRIALIGEEIIAEPEKHYHKFKELKHFFYHSLMIPTSKLHSILLLSFCEIFKNVLPAYKLRISTETEKGQRQKKETIALRDYEECLLNTYKFYLVQLESFLPSKIHQSCLKSKKYAHILRNPAKIIKLQHLVACCFGDLLIEHPNFNFVNNIIAILVPLLNNPNDVVSHLVSEKLSIVLANDATGKGGSGKEKGEVALEVVQQLVKYVTKRKYKVRPVCLRPLLQLQRLNAVNVHLAANDAALAKEEKRLKRMKFKLLSKKEKSKEKELKKVQKQLEAAGVKENEQRKCRIQTEIVQLVVTIYLSTIKSISRDMNASKRPLLSECLNGMRTFAHFINIEFFPDLFHVFSELIGSKRRTKVKVDSEGNASLEDCSVTQEMHEYSLVSLERLQIVLSVFTILSNDGSVLQLDCTSFIDHTKIVIADVCREPTTHALAVPLIVRSVLMMAVKQRRLTMSQAMSLTKSLAQLAVGCASSEHQCALIQLISQLLVKYKGVDSLMDSTDGPRRLNSINTNASFLQRTANAATNAGIDCDEGVLWELRLLMASSDKRVVNRVKVLLSMKDIHNTNDVNVRPMLPVQDDMTAILKRNYNDIGEVGLTPMVDGDDLPTPNFAIMKDDKQGFMVSAALANKKPSQAGRKKRRLNQSGLDDIGDVSKRLKVKTREELANTTIARSHHSALRVAANGTPLRKRKR